MKMPRYLYWRGSALWCRYPVPGWAKCYSLDIKTTGTNRDKKACVELGEDMIAAFRVKILEEASSLT